LRFLDHTQLDTDTLGRTPANEKKARRTCRYIHNTQQKQKKNVLALTEFVPAIPGRKSLHNYRSRRKASGFDVAT